jgi:hypothetical protein
MTQVTQDTINNWLVVAQAHVSAQYDKFIPQPRHTSGPVLTAMFGKKYARIVSADADGHHRSAWGFIDMTNGDVLKCAGWKAPAKNFARGNISDDQNGLGRASWTSVL